MSKNVSHAHTMHTYICMPSFALYFVISFWTGLLYRCEWRLGKYKWWIREWYADHCRVEKMSICSILIDSERSACSWYIIRHLGKQRRKRAKIVDSNVCWWGSVCVINDEKSLEGNRQPSVLQFQSWLVQHCVFWSTSFPSWPSLGKWEILQICSQTQSENRCERWFSM